MRFWLAPLAAFWGYFAAAPLVRAQPSEPAAAPATAEGQAAEPSQLAPEPSRAPPVGEDQVTDEEVRAALAADAATPPSADAGAPAPSAEPAGTSPSLDASPVP